ncbi:MAG: winged helix-turn-helix transcriptional regulator [Candidatus Bathyarchaeia archaeon]
MTKSTKQAKLRWIDVKVLEGLALYHARNMTNLAAQLNMPRETLLHRINHLRSHFSLYLQGNLYHTNIGLRKVVVLAESKPGYEDLLYKCLKCNDYWLYVSQCIGKPGCVATYGIPAGKENKFEEFINQLRETSTITEVRHLWSTCIHSVNTTSTWFDGASENWVFPWDLWLRESQICQGELPFTLRQSADYPQKADWTDIMILKELEKDCTIRLQRIAEKLGTSEQRIKYHYDNHVVKKQMFEGPQILADHYKELSPDLHFFIFSFKDHETFKKFACSLLDKPFVRAMGKVYDKNHLFVRIYMPRQELTHFITTLSKLVRNGFIETYEYVTEDATKTERQTISYEYFKNNKWEYDSEKYLERLQFTINESAVTC